ncbi:hypothetical protein SAMN05216559_2334 [Halomicrobium zhouii]|uniref:Uncharacterized protein n=1 Tax=Halomicrobium zhouii TaxID=767519 RepID=A0A1I6L9X7_9EURY|nr:hypothetical protein SAMN05216559_2334 [Halomicrobium zhouii]
MTNDPLEVGWMNNRWVGLKGADRSGKAGAVSTATK